MQIIKAEVSRNIFIKYWYINYYISFTWLLLSFWIVSIQISQLWNQVRKRGNGRCLRDMWIWYGISWWGFLGDHSAPFSSLPHSTYQRGLLRCLSLLGRQCEGLGTWDKQQVQIPTSFILNKCRTIRFRESPGCTVSIKVFYLYETWRLSVVAFIDTHRRKLYEYGHL